MSVTLFPVEKPSIESSNEWCPDRAAQVEALTEWLINPENIPVPDEILVSPTWRGQNTISPYLVEMNMTGEIWPELTEVEDEPRTGVPVPVEIEPEQWMTYPVEADNVAYREGASENVLYPEGFEEGLSVVMMARDLLLERYSRSGKTLFIVEHAHSGSLFFGSLEGYDWVNDSYDGHYLLNTGVQHLKQDPETELFEVVDTNINLDSPWG